MAATGDLRVDTADAQARRDRLRTALNDAISELDEIEANLGVNSTSDTAKADLQEAVRRCMLHSGVRKIGPLSTQVDQ